MIDPDLIPHSYRQMLLKKQVVKISLLLVSGIFASVLITTAAIKTFESRLAGEIVSLQEKKSISTRLREELTQLEDKKVKLNQELDLLNSLRKGAVIQVVLEMIDRAIPDEKLWFNNWQFQRAGKVTSENRETVATGYFVVVPAEAIAPGVADETMVQTRMNIKGQSKDHAALSEFVRRLYLQPEIRDIKVLRTSLQNISGFSIVEFDLSVIMNSSYST